MKWLKQQSAIIVVCDGDGRAVNKLCSQCHQHLAPWLTTSAVKKGFHIAVRLL